MTHLQRSRAAFVGAALLSFAALAAAEPAKVDALNFARAETDMYSARMLKHAGGLAKFHHVRAPTPIAQAYSVNNVTAKKSADGAYRIRFGGDPAGADNYLAIPPGWNYQLRLYRPRKAVLDGTWKAPEPQPVQ